MSTAALDVPIAGYRCRQWEEDGEQLRDWEPIVLDRPFTRWEHVVHPADRARDAAVWQRDDGVAFKVYAGDLLAGMRAVGCHERAIARIFDRGKIRHGAITVAGQTIGLMVLAHLYRGNPFRAVAL